MKLSAIFNVFSDSVELLPYSLNCIKGHVDHIIIVYQTVSNYGEDVGEYELFSDNFLENIFPETVFVKAKYTPDLKAGGMYNETAKRNIGLDIARSAGCTHFVCMDCDEMWEDFGLAKKQFIDSGALSSVAQMWTYFKLPTLRLAHPEGYYVPFISELTLDTKVGNYQYPFYCDPTRKPHNPLVQYTDKNVVLINEKMHHYSYIRKDIQCKIRNSTARVNIEKSTILKDYLNPDIGPGYYLKFFEQKLVDAPNIFGIEI